MKARGRFGERMRFSLVQKNLFADFAVLEKTVIKARTFLEKKKVKKRGVCKGLRVRCQVHLSCSVGRCQPSRGGGGHHLSLEVSARHAWPTVRQPEPGGARLFRFLLVITYFLRCTSELTGQDCSTG